jgi:predicted MFS family arabinose efflux permease
MGAHARWRAAFAITAVLLILLLAFDWDWLQGPVERRVSRPPAVNSDRR